MAQILTVAFNMPLHDRIFRGEFGLYELGTGLLAFLAVGGFAATVLKGGGLAKRQRALVLLLALGSLYFGGEELSWGQHFFGWATPELWTKANYQAETNLHNLWDVPFTNVLPRFALTLFALACAILPFVGRRRGSIPDHANSRSWLWPRIELVPVALLILLPPLPRRLTGVGLPEPGETEEFYMAALLFLYAATLLYRVLQTQNSPSHGNSG